MTTLTDKTVLKHQKESFDNAKLLWESMFAQMNTMGSETPMALALAKTMASEHRYIQAEVIAMLVNVICDYAETEYFDGRNERAVELSKKIYRSIGK